MLVSCVSVMKMRIRRCCLFRLPDTCLTCTRASFIFRHLSYKLVCTFLRCGYNILICYLFTLRLSCCFYSPGGPVPVFAKTCR